MLKREEVERIKGKVSERYSHSSLQHGRGTDSTAGKQGSC